MSLYIDSSIGGYKEMRLYKWARTGLEKPMALVFMCTRARGAGTSS